MAIDRPGGRTRRGGPTARALTALIAAVLPVAGCAAATNTLHPGRTKVTVTHDTELGPILVDDEGRTLYLFVQDPLGHSTCYDACAGVWPPVTTKGAPRGERVPAGHLSTVHRDDGGVQVVYQGHPLYYYQADTHRGDTHGEGLDQFGAEWYALSPAGVQVQPEDGGGP